MCVGRYKIFVDLEHNTSRDGPRLLEQRQQCTAGTYIFVKIKKYISLLPHSSRVWMWILSGIMCVGITFWIFVDLNEQHNSGRGGLEQQRQQQQQRTGTYIFVRINKLTYHCYHSWVCEYYVFFKMCVGRYNFLNFCRPRTQQQQRWTTTTTPTTRRYTYVRIKKVHIAHKNCVQVLRTNSKFLSGPQSCRWQRHSYGRCSHFTSWEQWNRDKVSLFVVGERQTCRRRRWGKSRQ